MLGVRLTLRPDIDLFCAHGYGLFSVLTVTVLPKPDGGTCCRDGGNVAWIVVGSVCLVYGHGFRVDVANCANSN
jgi:hypothetical protein